MADALKAEGNKLFAEKKFEESIEKFTQAIELDPSNHVLYSNRSGAYASLKDYTKAAKEAKAKADELKKQGTEFYKKRQFDEAIEKYNEAWETHKDITYKTNLGAAKFEKGDYEGCIQACNEAVEYGREIYAEYRSSWPRASSAWVARRAREGCVTM
ncbi:TPR-like protein [Paraphaeosphaeria sporulosa]|uniref:TPR-like protein n=1 Tax=Paraphaeosphaeria sporulosa TaxID=1460663 RepID=A0A177C3N5_9PLEO|nr:TPR-like protein [Paraphaeosphaeria sporulosa]OAG02016.1 TPR-like protein [Paraphaeosphaeria sporulosa]